MGKLRWFVAVVACAAGCNEGSSTSASKTAGSLAGALPGGPPATTPPATPAPAATPPSAPPLPELATDELYRAPGGGALFRYPSADLLGQRWTRKLEKQGDVTVIQLAHVDGARRAQVELRFPPAQPRPVPARTFAEAAASEITKAMPGAKVLGGRELPMPGGTAWGVGAEATLGGAKVVIGVVAITDGTHAALVTTIAHAELYDAPAVKPVLDAVFHGIRVGGKVTSAPALPAGAPLSGVFIRVGPSLGEVHLIQLDPRGYALLEGQVGTLDIDAAHASGTVARYTVSGDDVRITPARGRAWELTRNGSDLAEGRHNYCRAAATDGLTLDGRWESATFVNTTGLTGETFAASASSKYVFAPDGTYRDSSTVSATYSTPTTPGGAATPRVTGGGRDQGAGRYRIAGDRLELTRGGTTVRLPFYARACSGKLSTKMLVIDGALYLHDDD